MSKPDLALFIAQMRFRNAITQAPDILLKKLRYELEREEKRRANKK